MKKDYVILSLEKEYPGFTGTEKWMIITDLSGEDFAAKYPDQLQLWKQSVVMSTEMGKAILLHHCNEWKHKKRMIRREVPLDNVVISITPKDHTKDNPNKWLYDSLKTLTQIQRKRVILHCAHGISVKDIAEREKRSEAAIRISINAGLKKLRAKAPQISGRGGALRNE